MMSTRANQKVPPVPEGEAQPDNPEQQVLLKVQKSCSSGDHFDLEAAEFMEPIGIEHFFDAFSLDRKRPLKVDAASALRIPLNEVSDLLVVNQDRANRFEHRSGPLLSHQQNERRLLK